MEKFFRIFYYCAIGILLLSVTYLTFALAYSPKTDAKKRGFIPCTENFVLAVSDCEAGTIACPLKSLWQDTKCNLSVIFTNFRDWVYGTQPTPWSNYFFEPLTAAQLDEEEPYEGNVFQDMADMEKMRAFMEKHQQELYDAKARKLHFSSEVLLSEDAEKSSDRNYITEPKPESEDYDGPSDIADEAFMENFGDETSEEKTEISGNETVNSEGEKENEE